MKTYARPYPLNHRKGVPRLSATRGPLHVRSDEEPDAQWISPEFLFESVSCSFCGREGHKSAECRSKPFH